MTGWVGRGASVNTRLPGCCSFQPLTIIYSFLAGCREEFQENHLCQFIQNEISQLQQMRPSTFTVFIKKDKLYSPVFFREAGVDWRMGQRGAALRCWASTNSFIIDGDQPVRTHVNNRLFRSKFLLLGQVSVSDCHPWQPCDGCCSSFPSLRRKVPGRRREEIKSGSG